jgi:N-methylhydantoinase A
VLLRMGELRYLSQTHELAVPWPAGATTRESLARLSADFEDSHERTYGHRAADSMVELVNLHLVARGVPETPRVPAVLKFREEHAVASGARPAWFGREHGWLDTPVCSRGAVGSERRPGPLIVQEFDSTTLVPPGFMVYVDEQANVVMMRG